MCFFSVFVARDAGKIPTFAVFARDISYQDGLKSDVKKCEHCLVKKNFYNSIDAATIFLSLLN
jgi:hypothetical protein